MVSPPETFEYDAKVKYFYSKNNVATNQELQIIKIYDYQNRHK